MDLIDRQAVLSIIRRGMPEETSGSLLYQSVKQLPTVDAVEVVRCKDCKWYGRADKRRFYRGMDCLQKRICTIVPDRDYCSRAERRTDG